MSMSLYPSLEWRSVAAWLIALCVLLGIPAPAHAGDVTSEHARLAGALRQLDALEHAVVHSAAHTSVIPGERYHFDYPRLLADLARVRAGIQAHLTPSRAQPREPPELAGDYRTERATEPLPTTAGGKP